MITVTIGNVTLRLTDEQAANLRAQLNMALAGGKMPGVHIEYRGEDAEDVRTEVAA